MLDKNMITQREALSYQISNLPHKSIPKAEDFFANVQGEHKISAFNKLEVPIKEPKISQWDYLDQERVEALLELANDKEIYQFIASSLKNYPEGRAKNIFIQLLTDVTRFCQNQNYTTEKAGTVLSQFYRTNMYVTSGVDITAEKIYLYFKELTMCHGLPFPPSKKKVFTINEARDILEFFCKTYLRNLPLIRYLCLPNFALYLNYEIPPPLMLHFNKKKEKAKGKEKANKKKK